MFVVLVNPPHSAFDRAELGPPLGLLRLAGVARKAGWDVEIVDFNLLWHIRPELRVDFLEKATAVLLDANADVYGFGSMAVDSHVALELARRVKRARPTGRTVVGGTHFSAIGDEVSTHFPWIDAVVRGEGERDFEQLLASMANEGAPPDGERPRMNDYEAVDLGPYFSINPYRVVDVEAARGCRFSCTFCYSPSHYGKRRTLDPGQLLLELSFLATRGARHCFFVQDNFLNDEEHALSLCSALAGANFGLTWNCYATAPQINPRVVGAMARAGCRGIFTGIDAIGAASERRYGKRFSSGADEKIRLCLDHGIVPTCAFLVAPPSHPCGEDADETLGRALAARALGAEVRVNILTHYSRTRLAMTNREPLAWDERRVELEMDVPNCVVTNAYAREAPELFPFHARYVAADEWDRFTQQVHVIFTLLHARTDELKELDRHDGVDFFGLANTILAQTGDLVTLAKPTRRRCEVTAFDSLVAPAFSGA